MIDSSGVHRCTIAARIVSMILRENTNNPTLNPEPRDTFVLRFRQDKHAAAIGFCLCERTLCNPSSDREALLAEGAGRSVGRTRSLCFDAGKGMVAIDLAFLNMVVDIEEEGRGRRTSWVRVTVGWIVGSTLTCGATALGYRREALRRVKASESVASSKRASMSRYLYLFTWRIHRLVYMVTGVSRGITVALNVTAVREVHCCDD